MLLLLLLSMLILSSCAKAPNRALFQPKPYPKPLEGPLMQSDVVRYMEEGRQANLSCTMRLRELEGILDEK